jgi:hypothetical protein
MENTFDGWQSMFVFGLLDTSKGRAVGSAGRCRCISLSRIVVCEMMFAVVSKGASA